MPPTTRALTRADVLNAAMARYHNKQADLAKALGQSPATISRWKSGHATPEEGRCLRLAKITGFPQPEVLRAFDYDPEPLGLTSPPTLDMPPDYDLRLALRIADGLAKFASDVKAMIAASQPDYDLEALTSRSNLKTDYLYQAAVLITHPKITYLGGRRAPVVA
jgi:transcriptional regulator with XRE-family HTH domain